MGSTSSGHGTRGRLARTPLSNLLKAELRSVDEGSVELAMPGSPWFSNTGGAFYGGALALFADYAIHGAIQTTTLSAMSWATLDLRIRFVRPIIPDGRPLVARARIVHRGRRLAVAWVEVVTADEKVAAPRGRFGDAPTGSAVARPGGAPRFTTTRPSRIGARRWVAARMCAGSSASPPQRCK